MTMNYRLELWSAPSRKIRDTEPGDRIVGRGLDSGVMVPFSNFMATAEALADRRE